MHGQHLLCTTILHLQEQIAIELAEKKKKSERKRNESLKIYSRFSDRQVSLYGPRQVKELRGDELENLIDIYVVGGARKEESCFHHSCVCSGLQMK